jgi:UDP-3-O-[3-hydroxymyristoyl] glucosamine N-acyltransferase
MYVTAKEIAHLLNGRIEGDPEAKVSRPSKIEEGGKETISFLANPKYEDYAYTTDAAILLVANDFQPKQPIKSTLIRVASVYEAVAVLLEHFAPQTRPQSPVISQKASVHATAQLGEGCSVAEFSVISEGAVLEENVTVHPQVFVGAHVRIGAGSILYPGVRIYHDCLIGANCTLHSNVIVGGDGFGFAPTADGAYRKVPQVGNVIIEDEVEIGSNTTIDRATMGSTRIGRGVKLDNLIMVAHNVQIGENTVIAAQTGIAGSTKIGKNCQIGGQVGMVGHITIADNTRIQAQSGINRSIKEANSAWYGSPAIGYKQFLRAYSIFRQLPELARRVSKLEKKETPG